MRTGWWVLTTWLTWSQPIVIQEHTNYAADKIESVQTVSWRYYVSRSFKGSSQKLCPTLVRSSQPQSSLSFLDHLSLCNITTGDRRFEAITLHYSQFYPLLVSAWPEICCLNYAQYNTLNPTLSIFLRVICLFLCASKFANCSTIVAEHLSMRQLSV